jgi:hypothetical protein
MEIINPNEVVDSSFTYAFAPLMRQLLVLRVAELPNQSAKC